MNKCQDFHCLMITFKSVPYKKLSCGFGNLDSPIPDLLSLHGKEWDVHLKIHLSCSREVSFLSVSIQNKLQVAHNTKYNDFHSVCFSAIYSFLFYPSVALIKVEQWHCMWPLLGFREEVPKPSTRQLLDILRRSLTHREKREENKRKWLVSSSLESSSLILNNIYSSSAALIVRINCTFLSSEWRFKSKATN